MSLGLLLTLAGCNQEVLPPSGQACVVGELIFLGTPLVHEVEVEFDGCIPTCGRDIDPGCEVVVDGREILIDAWVKVTGPDDVTCGHCEQPIATCEWPKGLEGEYTVTFGDRVKPVSLPAGDQRLCLSAGQ